MILDAFTRLSDGQAVTDADAYSTNTIDLGDVTPKRVVGDGEPLALVITVDVAAAGDGSPASFTDTFDFMAVESVNADLSAHTVMAQRRVPGAELVAGALIVVNIPPGRPLKRYVGARYELGSGDTITVSAWLLPLSFIPRLVSYAKGYTID